MKKIFFLILCSAVFAVSQTRAQTEEKRNKVILTVVDAGKTIVTELNSVNLAFNRYENELEEPAASNDSSGVKAADKTARPGGVCYLTLEAKALSAEMLRVVAKAKTKFEGTITVTDPSTQKTLKTLRFKKGMLSSYSDQFSAVNYGDTYASSILSISCRDLNIDGIKLQ
ncbi:hypothetical protein CKK33_14995 [Mucilaginibacter sp. MD40]|uniref:type VI secretion system tube protein TssD n=1 Tax=Mucilaginibacter sp. MD40 TaxID=2029590 RepID=UPI000BAC6305|nr:type VI secretion system tube protein TssD [Mucilaginibacter sp. MD40]PAW94731.1 hypothetical protein CKK33_14995 [Mucilaginibacter sp. MD40]